MENNSTSPAPIDPIYQSKVYKALKDNLEGFNKTEQEFKNALKDKNYQKNVYKALKDNLDGFDKEENEFYSLVSDTKPTTQKKNPAQNGASNLDGGSSDSQSIDPKTGFPKIDQNGILPNFEEMDTKRPVNNKQKTNLKPPKQKEQDTSFFDYLKENLDTGLATVSKSIYDAPGFIYDAAASITNPILEAVGVDKKYLASSDKLARDLGFRNIPSEILKEKIKISNEKINEYAKKNGGDALAALEKGDYSNAAKLIAGTTVQSLPIMVAAMASGGETMALNTIGLSTASTKNAELKEEQPQMKLGTRILNATNSGVIEAVTGHLFTGASGAVMKRILADNGAEAGAKIISKSFKRTIENAIEKNPIIGALGEVVEETAVEFGNQANDIASGIRTEFDIHAIKNAGLSATGMGGLQTVGVYGAKGYIKTKDYNKIKSVNKEIFKLRTEIENGNLSDDNKQIIGNRIDRLLLDNKKLLGSELEKLNALPIETKKELNNLNSEFEDINRKFENIKDNTDLSTDVKQVMIDELKTRTEFIGKRKNQILSLTNDVIVDKDFSNFNGVEPDFNIENQPLTDFTNLSTKEQDQSQTEITDEELVDLIDENRQDQTTTNTEEKTSAIQPIGELTNDEFLEAIQNDNVSDERLTDIATKLSNNEKLSNREQKIAEKNKEFVKQKTDAAKQVKVANLPELTNDEYLDFIDNDKVSNDRLLNIAYKNENQLPLTKLEDDIYNSQKDKVNKIQKNNRSWLKDETLNQDVDTEFDNLLSGEAEQRRKDGQYAKDGAIYTRQEEQANTPTGNKGTVKFADNVEQEFEYALQEEETLQPAHINSKRNPLHFVPEMQPKNRKDQSSQVASDKIADNPKLEEAGENSNAYSGAPVVNARGEVIQGNNRSEGLKKHYQRGGTKYKQQLIDNAVKFGFTVEQIQGMNKPVLVRRVKVDDTKAIELGNYDAKDIETGGARKIDPVTTSRRIPQQDKSKITESIFENTDTETTLTEAIKQNFKGFFDKVRKYLNPAQVETILGKTGTPNADGIQDLVKLIQQFIFDGANTDLAEQFERLSYNAKQGLLKSLPSLLSVSKDKSLLTEVQNAIVVVSDFTTSKIDNFNEWVNQTSMFEEQQTPKQKYTDLELKIADLLINAKKQSDVSNVFKEYTNLVKDFQGDMFDPAREGLSKQEAISKIFNTNNKQTTNQNGNTKQQTDTRESSATGQRTNSEPNGTTNAQRESQPRPENEPIRPSNSKSQTEQPRAEQGIDEKVKPIRQLGTGANVYFENDVIRVNDSRDGAILMNVQSKEDFGGMAMWNIKFDNVADAVKVAETLSKIYPKGVPNAVLLEKVVENIQQGTLKLDTNPTENKENLDNHKVGDTIIYTKDGEKHIAKIEDINKKGEYKLSFDGKIANSRFPKNYWTDLKKKFKNENPTKNKEVTEVKEQTQVNKEQEKPTESKEEKQVETSVEIDDNGKIVVPIESYQKQIIELNDEIKQLEEKLNKTNLNTQAKIYKNLQEKIVAKKLRTKTLTDIVKSKETSTPEPKKSKRLIRDEKAEAKLNDALAELKKELGFLNSGINPMVAIKGAKVVSVYIEQGVYKLSDITEDLYNKMGELSKELFDAIKQGYASFRENADDETYSKLDENTRGYTYESLINKTNNNEQSNQQTAEPNQSATTGTLQPNSKKTPQTVSQELLQKSSQRQRTGSRSQQSGKNVSGTTTNVEQSPTGQRDLFSTDAGVLEETPKTKVEVQIEQINQAEKQEPALVEFNLQDNEQDKFNATKKYNDNIGALETLLSIIKEKRKATAEEKNILAKYVGFGGLKEIALNPDNEADWKESTAKYKAQVRRVIELTQELDTALGVKNSLSEIRAGILTAHYTPKTIIDTMFDVLEKLGFEKGNILEPSAGIGNFIGYMPSKMRSNSKISAVELDNITGNILKYLYDDVNTQITGIQDAIIPDNSQDVVISNVPFGAFKVFDKAFKGNREFLTKRIHNYFFAKALDKVREGGIVMFVTSKGVLDSKGNQSVREYLNQNADFLGAVRLPSTAFQNNANTSVVTDVIILRKNTTGEKKNPNFIDVVDIEVTDKNGETKTITINKFIQENRGVLIGNIVPGGMYSEKDYSLIDPDNKMDQLWDRILTSPLRHFFGTYQPITDLNATNRIITVEDLTENTKDRNIVFGKDGKLYKRIGNDFIEVQMPSYVRPNNVKKYIDLRDALFDLIYSEYTGQSESLLDKLRQRLNFIYNDARRNISSKEFNRIATEDGDGFNVLALTDKNGKRADILSKRTINPLQQKQNTDNIDEATIISLYENAKIDMNRIAELMQKPVKEILELAKGKIFESPTGGFFARDEYLSGNVKKKLAEVNQAIENGYAEFEYNKTELEAVIPKDIPVVSIEARLGSRWVPLDIIQDFAQHLFNDSSVNINYAKSTDTYNIVNNVKPNSVNATEKWGTKRRNGLDLLIDALHIATPVIYDTTEDKKRVVNKEETEQAVQKYEEIRAEFENWIYRDVERRERLGQIYNEKYNTTVRRKYDGSHLNIPGINGVNLYQHQKDAIWMLLQNNGGIIDHIVGAGKTFVMVAGTAEMKRTGVSKKPMILALKSTIPQIVETYKQSYPLAKILAPSEKDFQAKNRQQLFSQIAINDWDVIIMSHENYQAIPHHPDYIRKEIDDEIATIEVERDALSGDKKALQGLETRLKNLEARLEKLTDIAKDNTVYFQQMGIDHIMVDESQQFKNLAYMTKQRNVAGLSKAEGSRRAFNLLVGMRYLQETLGADKGTTFLSGTPISNSMVEMYSLLKYMRPNKMAELGFNTFDQWATTFANPTNEIEYTVTGQFKSKTRFREFINVPELSLLYNEIADVRNDDNLVLDKPKMKGDGYTTMFIPMNNEQREYGEKIIEFAKTKKGSVLGLTLSENQKQAYMLLATNLSSKMAIDMRLINKDFAYDPNGKVGKMTDEILKVYTETNEHKGTQLIFSDLGTPKNKNNQSELLKDYLEDELGIPHDTLVEIFGNYTEEGYKIPSITAVKQKAIDVLEIEETDFDEYLEQAKQSGETFNLYTDIKQKLIEKGIPENEIVFIHSYNNQKAKEKLFEQVNNGEIRVVLGSTQKLGTGVNVQKRLAAIHHLDVPWRPSDMEQRNGRGIRQGNWIAKEHLNNVIPVYAYATERTLDGYKYQLLQTKQRFLDQVKSGNVEDRTIRENSEDGNDAYAIFVAELSGNKDILTKFKLEQEKERLTKQKRNFDAALYEAQANVRKIEGNIPAIQENIAKSKQDIEEVTDKAEYEVTTEKEGVESKKLKIETINGEVLKPAKDSKEAKENKPVDRTEYGKKAIELINETKRTIKIGEYTKAFEINGLPILIKVTNQKEINNGKEYMIQKTHLAILGSSGQTYTVNYSQVAGVLLNNIQKTIEGIPSILEMQQRALEKNKKDLSEYKELAKNDKFPKEEELSKVADELKEIDKKIQDFEKDVTEELNTANEVYPKEVEANKSVEDDKIRIGDMTYPMFNEDVDVSMVEGQNKKTGEKNYLVKINKQLDYQNEYKKIVEPLMLVFGGVWNKSHKAIIFNTFGKAENVVKNLSDKLNLNNDLDSGIRFSIGQETNPYTEVINGFYSTLEKIINETKFDKLPAKQWIDKFAKGEEAKWTGLTEWLSNQTTAVSKTDIQNYLKDNRIEVKEVVKDDKKGLSRAETIQFNKIHKEIDSLEEQRIAIRDKADIDNKNAIAENIPEYQELTKKIKTLMVDWEMFRDKANDISRISKFSQYQLEGDKKNYKEVLVTMPNKIDKIKVNSIKEEFEFERKGYYIETDENGNNYAIKKEKTKFKSSHFDEPNILVHLRMNTRTDAEGNKVLFLEEVQSDWGQKGKKEGFIGDKTEANKLRDEFDKKYGKGWGRADLSLEDFNRFEKSNIDIQGTPQAPFVTDTNAWTKLGLKVALKEAVAQGVDKIAWTTGEQQNDRYDLSKQVDWINAEKTSKGDYKIEVGHKDNRPMETQYLKENELEANLGKELATKIVNDGGGMYKGLDLKVGGKGMKGFYGSPTEGSLGIVGNVAKSLFKQEPKTIDVFQSDKLASGWSVTTKDINGNVQINMFDSKSKGLAWLSKQEELEVLSEDAEGKNYTTQHSITITPEMRAEVQSKGQPLFMFASRKDTRPFETTNPKPATKENLQKEFPNAIVIQSESELPQAIQNQIRQQRAESKVKGVYHNGAVYMVADNIKTIGEATGTYRHETLGHKGVIEHLGTKLNEYTTRIIDNAKGGQLRKLQELAAKYGLPTDLNALTDAQKQILGEEYIAHISENKSTLPKTWNDLVSFIREAIRKFGINLQVTDTEIQALIGKVEKQQKARKELENQNINNNFVLNTTNNGQKFLSLSEPGTEYNNTGELGLQQQGNTAGNTNNRRSVRAVWTKYKNIQFKGTTKVKNAEDVAQIMSLLENKSVEHAFAIHIDEKGNSYIQFLSIGGTTATVIDANLVSAGVSKFNSKKVYLVHNHPSGNMQPSPQDLDVTNKLRLGLHPLGIEVEHIIMNTYKKQYIHIDNDNTILVNTRGENTFNKKLTPIALTEQEILSEPFGKVSNSENAFSIIQNFRFSAMPKNAMLVLDQTNKVIGNYIFNGDITYNEILKFVGDNGIGRGVIFYGNQANNLSEVRDFQKNLKNLYITVLDKIVTSSNNDTVKEYYESMANMGMLNEHQEQYGTGDSKFNIQDPQAELDTIKEKALADGTFMKAPNGKPTNLNEKQWLQTRTKAFKEWFGDWELMQKTTNIVKAINHNFKNYKEAEIWGKENIVGNYLNKDTGEKINVSGSSIEKFTNGTAVNKSIDKDTHLSTLQALPKLIENAILVETHNDRDNNSNIKSIQRLYSAVEINGKINRVKLTVKVYADIKSNKAYSYEVAEIEMLDRIPVDASSTSGLTSNSPSSILIANLLQNSVNNKGNKFDTSFSKVIDENGEPLVVYHGTNADFNEFDKNKGAYNGFYFTAYKDYNYIKKYTNRIIPSFLNIKNPPKIEPLNLGLYGQGVFSEKEILAGSFLDLRGSEIKNIQNKGYDGLMGDLKEQDDSITKNIEIVVFSPNQIKSATDNVGTFNEGNNDIRFQLSDNKPLRLPQTIARQTLDQMKADTRNKVSKNAMIDNAIDFIQNSNWYKNLEDNQKARVNKTALKSLLENSIKDTNYLEDKIEDYKQQIKDNKLTSKQVFDDIIAFLKTNQIKGKITPTEINRLIKSAAEITTKKDTTKALDDFMKLYEVIKEKALLRVDNVAKEKAEVEYVIPIVESLVESGYDLDMILNYFDTDSQKRMAEVQYHKEKSKQATEEERVNKTKEALEKQKQDLHNATHTSFREGLKKARLWYFNLVSDRSYVPANLMDKTGMQQTYYQFKNTKGYGHNAKEMYEKAHDKIWKGLTQDKIELLNDVVQMMRIITIDNNREQNGLSPVQHPNNLSKTDAQAWLDNKKTELGDKAFNDIQKRAKDYFKAYQEVLELKLEHGFISQETYDALNGLDYQPRLFLHHALNFDGDLSFDQKQHIITRSGLSKEQIKRLEDGSDNSLIGDAQWLLSNSISTIYQDIADNTLNKLFMDEEFPIAKEKYDTLLGKPKSELTKEDKRFIDYFKELSDKVIPNDIIGFNESTNEPIYKNETPNHFVNKYYWADGVKHQFFMEENLAQQFEQAQEGFLKSNAKEIVGNVTGSRILKFFATGNNPLFVVVNTPRDFMWNIQVSEHYSTFLPIAMAQMSYQLLPATYDFIKTKLGRENTDMKLYFQHGGSMDYLHKQGQIANKSWAYNWIMKPVTSIAGKNNQPIVEDKLRNNYLSKGVGAMNEWSEIAFRIATFRRSVNAQIKELGYNSDNEVTDLTDENGIVVKTKQDRLNEIYRKATYDARSVLDFSQGGRLVKDLEEFIPYTNVAVQATRSYADAMKKRPVSTTLKTLQIAVGTTAGAITLAMYLLSGDDDEPEEEKGKTVELKYVEFMQGISKDTRAKYYIIPTKQRDKDGNRIFYKIAKDQMIIPYMNLVETLIENRIKVKTGKYKETSWDKIQKQLFSDVLDYNLAYKTLKDVPLFKAGAAAYAGYDSYRDKNFDKYAKAEALEGMNNENVEDFYKHFGRELGISPIRTKSAIESIITSPHSNPYLATGYEVMDYAFTDKSMESLGKGIQEMLLKGLKNRTQGKSTEWTRTENILSNTKDEQEEVKLKEEAIRQLFKNKAQDVIDGKITEDEGLIKLQAQYGNDYNYDSYEDSYFREIEKAENKEEMTTAMEIIKKEDSPAARAIMIEQFYGDINNPANAKIKEELENEDIINEATLRYLEKKKELQEQE